MDCRAALPHLRADLIIADVLGVGLTVEEISVGAYLAEHPESAPFLCHRIYDLSSLAASGLSVPSTAIEAGLRLHDSTPV